MTVDDWVVQFTAEAAQLPGWQLCTQGRLRRVTTRSTPGYGDCPLRAQWRYHAPPDGRIEGVHALWSDTLSSEEVQLIADAADDRLRRVRSRRQAQVRARLLSACGVQEQGAATPSPLGGGPEEEQ